MYCTDVCRYLSERWVEAINVPDHDGGRPKEINAWFLYTHIHSDYYYIHIYRLTVCMAQSPCSFLPLAPFSIPLSLTWRPSLLWWDPVHSGPRLLINWALNTVGTSGEWGRGVLRVEGGQSLLLLGSQGTYLYTPIPFTLYINPAVHFKWIEWNCLY